MKKTPLYELHCDHQAKIVDFTGYAMPIWYTGIIDEHNHVRQACGIFDVCHMAEFIVSGTGSQDFLDRLTTNNIPSMHSGKVMYTLLCHEDGGCINDLLIYMLKKD